MPPLLVPPHLLPTTRPSLWVWVCFPLPRLPPTHSLISFQVQSVSTAGEVCLTPANTPPPPSPSSLPPPLPLSPTLPRQRSRHCPGLCATTHGWRRPPAPGEMRLWRVAAPRNGRKQSDELDAPHWCVITVFIHTHTHAHAWQKKLTVSYQGAPWRPPPQTLFFFFIG